MNWTGPHFHLNSSPPFTPFRISDGSSPYRHQLSGHLLQPPASPGNQASLLTSSSAPPSLPLPSVCISEIRVFILPDSNYPISGFGIATSAHFVHVLNPWLYPIPHREGCVLSVWSACNLFVDLLFSPLWDLIVIAT
jgi:hypothetical protein